MAERGAILAGVAALAVWSSAALAIPPALPEDAERMAEAERQRQEYIAILQSPEARVLVELFFERMGEGDVFEIGEIFTENATYVSGDGEWTTISEDLDDDGFPGIAQWQLIEAFRLGDSWAAAASLRLEPVGILEAVLKFHFSRDSSGALKISRIEEVRL